MENRRIYDEAPARLALQRCDSSQAVLRRFRWKSEPMNPPREMSRACDVPLWQSFALLSCVLLGLARTSAVEDQFQPASEVITNIARIWNFPEPLRSKANPVKLTVTVNYYDARWG